jgi:hypothetical protein
MARLKRGKIPQDASDGTLIARRGRNNRHQRDGSGIVTKVLHIEHDEDNLSCIPC